MTKLFIQIKDGQPVGHAVHEDNLRMLGIDPDDPTDEFEPYEFSPAPELHPLECEHYEPHVKADSGKWTRPRCAIERPEHERKEITARYLKAAQQDRAYRLSIANSRKDKNPNWKKHRDDLAALDVNADPFAIQWPAAPDELKPMKVHRV